MRKIVVSLSKGGVGKTTTAVNLAAGLAASSSTKVLLIDTDTQGQAGSMLGVETDIGLAELMLGECRPDEAVVEARKNLFLLAGGRALAGIQRLIVRKEFGGEQTLAEAMSAVDSEYDYVILDTPPGCGQTIFEYDARSPGAKDYRKLTKRIARDAET